MMRRPTIPFAALLALATTLALPTEARAGGFFFTDRGARPAGRGFAFVAGADDPQALAYNPAGLVDSGTQLLFDLSYTWFRGEYARVDSGGNAQPAVDLDTLPLPIPGVGMSHLLRDDLALGVGIFAPNAVLGDYADGIRADGSACNPDTDVDCSAAPQRYALYSLAGTALAQIDVALAFRPHPRVTIGAGLGVFLGVFGAEVAFSACDNAICAQPENPDFDTRASMTVTKIWDLAPHVGVLVDLDSVRIGGSFRAYPRGVQGTADLNVRLPADPFFDGAEVEGDKADVEIALPMVTRLGVEVRPLDALRIEAAVVWERWSRQQSIEIRPRDITLENVTAIGGYAVGDLSVLRDMNDTVSLRLGGECRTWGGRLNLLGGFSLETSGFDDRTLTALTIDTRKISLNLGLSLHITRNLIADLSYAHLFLQDRMVDNSEVARPEAIRPPLTGADQVFVGNGRYDWEADMFAAGLRYRFDAPDDARGVFGDDDVPEESEEPLPHEVEVEAEAVPDVALAPDVEPGPEPAAD